jgi:drug/metabolite transporter (DMT)-like permease
MLNSLVYVHLAVILFGISGLFGKFLLVPSVVIVFGRTFFAALALLVILPITKQLLRYKNYKYLFYFILMGAILAIHWVSFFYSIQISTVAIGLLTFSTFPVFVTFLEPVFFKDKLRQLDVIISIVVFGGLLLVIPEFDFSNNLTQGAFWGTVSGLTFAVLSLLNRKYVAGYSALTIGLYQNSIACLVLLPFAYNHLAELTGKEIWLLLLLGVVFTALAHTLFIKGMERVKTQLASIIACLEPVYGIFFAFILIQEVPTIRELFGGVIIIASILFATKKSS